MSIIARLSIAAMLASFAPGALAAQENWTGIGSIAGTVMFMDTTTIVRQGSIRKAWIKSLDTTPKKVLLGKDTLTFDTVVALNVFDCVKHTRTVSVIQYELEGEVVLEVPEAHDPPARVKPGSFFGAVYKGLCEDEP